VTRISLPLALILAAAITSAALAADPPAARRGTAPAAAPAQPAAPQPPRPEEILRRIDSGDYTEATVSQLKTLVRQGNLDAASRLADMLSSGVGVEFNLPEAYRLYAKLAVSDRAGAAEQAVATYARMTRSGRVVADKLIARSLTNEELEKFGQMIKPPEAPQKDTLKNTTAREKGK